MKDIKNILTGISDTLRMLSDKLDQDTLPKEKIVSDAVRRPTVSMPAPEVTTNFVLPRNQSKWSHDSVIEKYENVPVVPVRYSCPAPDCDGTVPYGEPGACVHQSTESCVECGHPSYRHFDWGNNYAAGCKYCECLYPVIDRPHGPCGICDACASQSGVCRNGWQWPPDEYKELVAQTRRNCAVGCRFFGTDRIHFMCEPETRFAGHGEGCECKSCKPDPRR